jgi:prepilin-type N-terminal cleavage/methylation domain-containing protein
VNELIRVTSKSRGVKQGEGTTGTAPNLTRLRGFTLIEIVAVLAVLAILAAIVAENVLTRLRDAARQAEVTSLSTLAKTLQESVIRTKYVPAATNMVGLLAVDLALPANRVSHNAAGNPRWFWVDPNCQVTLPYTQTAFGSSARPQRVRLAVVSSVGAALPARTSGPSASEFESVWNTAPQTVPSAVGANWGGQADDLKIQRMDVGSLFCQVMLENVDFINGAPYSVDTTNTLTTVPSGTRRDFWLLTGTVLNFHYTDNSLQGREYVMEDVGYTFENGRWGRYLRYGPNRSNGWFGEMVDKFLAAPPPPGYTRRYATQQWVIDAMYQFLYCFGQWSLDSFYGGPPWPHIPGYEQSSAGSTGLQDYSSDLLIYR